MGAFYGSVQVRSEDHGAVKVAAEKVAQTIPTRMLVGPAIDGWVGLYPEMNGQDERVGAAIAGHIDADVLHFILHDDDVFAYWLYRRGELVDSFWSVPGYFGEENRTKDEAMAGNPEAFRPILGGRIMQLEKLLIRGEEQGLTADDQLAEFAKALKISNAFSAYEYLKAGETEGVKKWRQFAEVPAERISADTQISRKSRSEVNAARKKFKSDGLLLLHDERKQGSGPRGCAVGGGFIVAWADHGAETISFATYEPPWDGPKTLDLKTSKHLTGLASDATGRRVAMSVRDCVHVWDVADGNWSRAFDVPERDVVFAAVMSTDGKLVAHASRNEVVVTGTEPNRRVCAVPLQGVRQLVFHPNGEWLAVAGNNFGLISIHSQPKWRDIYVGGKKEVASSAAVAYEAMQSIDFDEVERLQRIEMEKMIKKLKKSSGSSKQPAMSDAEIQQFRERMEQSMRESRARMVEWKEGRVSMSQTEPIERVWSVSFSRDGRSLYCGTDGTVQVYNWAEVPREAGSELVETIWECKLPEPPEDPEQPDRIWAIAEEIDSQAVVCGGSAGRLYRLDIESRQMRELTKLPGEACILGLAMSADGATLGVAAMTKAFSEAARKRFERTASWEVWSYPRLRASM